MIYTKLTKLALKLCYEKHHGQFDKSGIAYVFHPFYLASQMDDEDSICVALLHDIVEDTDVSFSDLEELGFPKQIIDALRLLTHDKDVDYFEYVGEIKKNSLAKKVKIADLKHNSMLERFNEITQNDLDRQKKYQKALEILTK